MPKTSIKTYFTGAKPDYPGLAHQDQYLRRSITSYFKSMPETLFADAFKQHVYDQGEEGTCVPNSWANSIWWKIRKKYLGTNKVAPNISRRWLMQRGQALDPWPETSPDGEDGTDNRSVGQAAMEGLVLESTLPYKAGDRNPTISPETRQQMKVDMGLYRVKNIARCHGRDGKPSELLIKQGVYYNGSTIISCTLPKGFYDIGKTGKVPLSKKPAGGADGMHDMLITGWTKTEFIILNSWGNTWGMEGFCYWQIDAFLKACEDAWTIGDVVCP